MRHSLNITRNTHVRRYSIGIPVLLSQVHILARPHPTFEVVDACDMTGDGWYDMSVYEFNHTWYDPIQIWLRPRHRIF